MTETERLQALLLKIKDHFCDGVAALLARQIGKDPSYVNRLFYPEGKAGAKGIGIEIMDACKRAFPLPRGYWDMQPDDFVFRIDPLAPSERDAIAYIMSTPQSPQNQAIRLREAAVEWANVEPRASIGGSVPLMSWIRAGDFCESPNNFAQGDAEEYLPRPLQNMGKNVFALTVKGESMDTPDGYREGEIVYIDPDKSPVSGNDVVARVENKLNLKRYKEDQDGPYLLQLNGNIIIRPEGDWSVCGVVVFSGKRR